MKRGKKYQEAVKKIDRTKLYTLQEAAELVKSCAFAKFTETVELSVTLTLKKSQSVRDTVVLPNQFMAQKRILVFAKGDKAEEAKAAGAAFVGDNDLIEKIRGGWMDFDVAVATPDMMKDVGRLGPILGRRGLMPNPKTHTVTNDIKEAYLLKYMDLCSTYIDNIENYRSQLRKTAKTGGFEKIMENLRSANYTDAVLHDFYAEFDATFLKLFPDFVSQLNAMLQPDKRQKDTSADGILTTELRVMALIRLGINDSTKIAHFLRRSLSTIYNYRVKIRNAATEDRDNFESRVMHISFSPARNSRGKGVQ